MSVTRTPLDSKGRPKVQRGGRKPVTQRPPDGLSRPPGIEEIQAEYERQKRRALRRGD